MSGCTQLEDTASEAAFLAACDRVRMSSPTFAVMLSYVEKYGEERVTEWIEISEHRLPAWTGCGARGRYISGIRRKWLQEQESAAQEFQSGGGI